MKNNIFHKIILKKIFFKKWKILFFLKMLFFSRFFAIFVIKKCTFSAVFCTFFKAQKEDAESTAAREDEGKKRKVKKRQKKWKKHEILIKINQFLLNFIHFLQNLINFSTFWKIWFLIFIKIILWKIVFFKKWQN